MEPKAVKKVLSEDTYDDCTACRVTGTSACPVRPRPHKLMIPFHCRFYGHGHSWRLELLLGHVQPAAKGKGNYEEYVEVQDGIEAAWSNNIVCDTGGYGYMESIQLNEAVIMSLQPGLSENRR